MADFQNKVRELARQGATTGKPASKSFADKVRNISRTAKAPKMEPKKKMSPAVAFMTTLADSASFGAVEKGVAAQMTFSPLKMGADLLQGKTPNKLKEFRQNYKDVSEFTDKARKDAPWAATAGDVAGFVAPMVVSGGATAIPQAVGRGASRVGAKRVARAMNPMHGSRAARGAAVGGTWGAGAGVVGSPGWGTDQPVRPGRVATDAAVGGALGAGLGAAIDGPGQHLLDRTMRLFGGRADRLTPQQLRGASADVKSYILQRPREAQNITPGLFHGRPPGGTHRADNMSVPKGDIAQFVADNTNIVNKRLDGLDPKRPYAVPGLMGTGFTHALESKATKRLMDAPVPGHSPVGKEMEARRHQFYGDMNQSVGDGRQHILDNFHTAELQRPGSDTHGAWKELLKSERFREPQVKALAKTFPDIPADKRVKEAKKWMFEKTPDERMQRLVDYDKSVTEAELARFDRELSKPNLSAADKNNLRMQREVYEESTTGPWGGDSLQVFRYDMKAASDAIDPLSYQSVDELAGLQDHTASNAPYQQYFGNTHMTNNAAMAIAAGDSATAVRETAPALAGEVNHPIFRLGRRFNQGPSWSEAIERVLLDRDYFRKAFGQVEGYNRHGLPLATIKGVPTSAAAGNIAGRTTTKVEGPR